MRVVIVGAGFGGCGAAIALAQDGHDVTVLEAVENPGPVGAGIMLQPSGLTVLARFGLLDAVLRHGEPCARLRCVTREGRTLFYLPYAARHPDLYGLGIHRGALFHALFDALEPNGVKVRLGVAATNVDDGTVIDASGERHGPYDLVVIADGARSRLRTTLGHATRDDEYPWGALWFVADDPERAFRDELFQTVDGTGTMIGLLPTGTTPDDPVPHVSLFCSVRLDRVASIRARGLEAWKEDVRTLMPRTAPILDPITNFDELLLASYRDVRLPRLDFGRSVYVGDAAHAMSPQLGQGSNLALIDAAALADAIREERDLPRALATYSRRRRSQLAFYQWMSRALTPFFQGDSRALGVLRDLAFPVFSRLPIVRSEMVATMSGVKQGLVGRTLPIAPKRLALPARGGATQP